MNKFMALTAALLATLAIPAAQRDEKAVKADMDKLAAFMESEDGKAAAALDVKGFLETRTALTELAKRFDEQAAEVRRLQKMGLGVHGGQILVPGRQARLDMLDDRRAFAQDETAERFAAYILYRSLGAEAPQRVKELGADVCKAGDIDPSSGSAGEYAIPDEFRMGIIRNVEAVAKVFVLMNRVPLSTLGQTTFLKRSAGLTAYPTAALAAITKSAPTLGTVTLQPVKWATLTGIPNEMLRSGTLIDIGQFLGMEITYALARAFDNAVLNGDGTADFGGITGILQSGNISSVAAAATHTTLATVDATDVGDVIGGLAADYAVDNARWGMHLSVQRKLRNIRTDDGLPVFQRGDAREPNTIDGYPYTISQRSTAAASVTAGVKYGWFGDLRLSHFFGMLGQIRIDTSEHVWFANDMSAMRGVAQVDCQEADADAVVTAKTAAQ